MLNSRYYTKLTGFILFYWRQVWLGNRTYRVNICEKYHKKIPKLNNPSQNLISIGINLRICYA